MAKKPDGKKPGKKPEPAKKAAAPDEKGIGQQNPEAFKRAERPAVKKANRQADKRAAVRDVREGMRRERGTGEGWSFESPTTPTEPTGPWTGYPGQRGNGPGVGQGTTPSPTNPAAWPVAEALLKGMGFTPGQIASLKTQLWGEGSDLRLYYGDSGWETLVRSRLYDTPEFKERFPAVAQSRANNPQDFIGVEEVLEYENSWEKIMPPATWGMFPKRETITQLMLGGVSLQELQSRVQTATWAAATAPAAVRQQLADRYGISVDALVGFYLDPAKGEEWLQSQTMTAAARAAGIGAGLGLTWEQSQHIIEQGGLTETGDYSTIASGFAKAGGLRSLQEGYGQTATAEQIANSALLDEAGASTVVARTLEGKRGRFNRQAGVAETREGVVGLRTSSST